MDRRFKKLINTSTSSQSSELLNKWKMNLRVDPVEPFTEGCTTGFPPLVPVKVPEMGLGVTMGLAVDCPGPGVGIGVGMLPLQSGMRQQESEGSARFGQLDAG